MVGHHDTVSSVEGLLLSLEEVIGVEEMNGLLPSLSCLLVALELWVVSDEDSRLNVLASWEGSRVLSSSPSEVEDVTLQVLPRVSKIFSDVELLVDLTWLVICEVLAGCPSSSQSPRSLLGMELELMNLLPRVQCSEVCSAVFCDPVDSVSA